MVEIGNVVAVPTNVSDTAVTFAIPPGAPTGHVKVFAANGSVTSTDTFAVTG